jgi:hypothetical protein
MSSVLFRLHTLKIEHLFAWPQKRPSHCHLLGSLPGQLVNRCNELV